MAIIADVGVLHRRSSSTRASPASSPSAKYIDAARVGHPSGERRLPDKESLLKAAEGGPRDRRPGAAVLQGVNDAELLQGQEHRDGLEYVAARSAMILPSEDLADTMASFMEKKPVQKGNRKKRKRLKKVSGD